MDFHVGVDIGGTFTDTIALDEAGGEVRVSKVPSTPENQAVGFVSGLRAAAVDCAAISWLVHGTTVGTNATLERNGAKCGLITTRGFRDILELGRRQRPQLYGLHGGFEPLIARDCRLEVSERLDAEGNVLVPLDEAGVEAAARQLRAMGCQSLLIGFLHSYANRSHEDRAREIAQAVWDGPFITTSVDVLGEFREVERFGTAAVNAYIQPLIHRYVMRLRGELAAAGVRRDLAIMQTNGGIMSADAACRRSVNTVMSGPAAGVIAARYIAGQGGFRDVITCDMGGTSFDVGLIDDGEPAVSNDRDLGFNLPMRIPIIDIHTIGSGGGSIAHIDSAGILRVGPKSAGARPGPVAFGRGGTRPTVTDANVMLGRLASDRLLSVAGSVDMERVAAAFRMEIGEPLGLDAHGAAAAVLKVVNDAMAGAIRAVSLQRGHDPREFSIFAFGGAGPLHGVALARELGVPRVIVPYLPGITCALGCIVADVRHDYVRTVSRPLDAVSAEEIRAVLAEQRAEGEGVLHDDRVPVERVEVQHLADMQYEGQSYTVRIPVTAETLDVGVLRRSLSDAYRERFGIDLSSFRPKLINLRTRVLGVRRPPDLRRIAAATHRRGSVADALIARRTVHFDGGPIDTPVYDRAALPFDARIEGPAIFNQMDTTTVAEPDTLTAIDAVGNLIIEVR